MRRHTKRSEPLSQGPAFALGVGLPYLRETDDERRPHSAYAEGHVREFLHEEDGHTEDDLTEEDAHQEAEDDGGQAPDDTLGLYLRQMGAIPLLNRDQELALARRLEKARGRYRHAALWSWRILAQVVNTFERVLAGQLALDPSIDVVTSLDLSREQI